MDLDKVDEISKQIDDNEDGMREKYPELFKYVDLLNGVIVSIGSHPAGTIVSPFPLEGTVGTCSLKTNERPVTVLDMKEIDSLNFVKLDILTVDNIQLINETCELAGIERLTPDNVDVEDEKVWKSIRDDTTCIFQWDGSGSHYIKDLFSDKTISKIRKDNPSFKYIDLFSIGNGALRPSGSSFRNELAQGDFHDNGHEALNEFMSKTRGFMSYQETIMSFLNKFAGFSLSESDLVRVGFAKKTGTEQYIPKIKQGFIETMQKEYHVKKEVAEELIEQFLIIIENASSYGFSLNHSLAYSFIGYVNGYLRYYYPLEFLTSALNTFGKSSDKISGIMNYMNTKTNIKLKNIKFGFSHANYSFNKDTNSIYQGIESIKFCNSQIANELFELGKNNYTSFTQLLKDIATETSVNSRQLKILISLNFFSEFGKNKKLLTFVKYFDILNGKKQFSKAKIHGNNFDEIEIEQNGKTIKKKFHLPLEEYEQAFIDNSRQTAKTYMDLDTDKVLDAIWSNIEDEQLPLKHQIENEVEYLGYIEFKEPRATNDLYFVSEYKSYSTTKPKPYVTLYRVKDGGYIKTRVDSDKDFIKNPFELHSVLRINEFVAKPRFKIIDGKYHPTGETQELIKRWEVLQ